MRPTEVTMPDQLWRNRGLTDGAKALWCYLYARAETKLFGCAELRRALRISQNSLLRYLAVLEEHGWLRQRKAALRKVIIHLTRPTGSGGLRVPTDLLLDRNISRPAVWVWCVIRRHGASFGYTWLQNMTGYTQPSISKYLRQLRAAGWLTGSASRNNRFVEFHLKAHNPVKAQRQAEIAELERGVAVARRRKGYSVAQYALARMVKLRLAQGTVVENAELTGLGNPKTGGQMHYDILIPEYKVALEFQGPQHFGPTERFPDAEAYQEQRTRDLIKRGLSLEQGTTLLVITTADLRFDRIDKLLAPYVPLREESGHQWHIRHYLERLAANYRQKAAGMG